MAVLVSVLVGLLTICSRAAGQEAKQVFVLNSFNRGYPWTDNMLRGIDDVFRSSDLKVETYVTFMDMKRIPPTQHYFSQLKELIREGYKGVRFDAVLACDNDALEFMRKYRDELFPGLPVVFSSINDYDERMRDGRRDITGTSENTDYAGTIGVALKLRPATRTIVVVTDNTTTGKAHRSAVERIRPDFARLAFIYISLADLTLDELAQQLARLDRDCVVLLLHHFVDRNGISYTIQQSTRLLTQSSPVPVLVLTESRMGLGALGGVVVSGYHYGKASAQMVEKILKGVDIRSIPVQLKSPNMEMFDYSVMQRFKIAERDLPQGSIVINKPVSVLDQYRPHILAVLGVFFALCSLLFFLVLEIRSRRRSEERHRAILQTAMDGFWLVDTQGHLREVNETYCRMSGYGAQELLTMRIPDLEFVEAADGMAELSKKVMIQGEDRFESRHRRKDGSVFDVEISVQHQSTDQGGRLVAFLRDITARKKAEEALRASLAEKVALLNEVHHRVKNNLQVITSLLRMEARRSEHPTTKTVLDEMKNRILSMALLHDSLYRSGTFASVDLGDYLKQLTTQSFRAQIVRPGSVRLHVDLASVQVEMDQAMPCGLLVNELISNCLKHGFPGDHSGEVRVELQPMIGGPKLRLRVSDTGVGLPADFESKRDKSLGLQLVSSLAMQIDGRLEVGPGPGAVFDVIFTPKYSKPIPSIPPS